MRLPCPRGPISTALVSALPHAPRPLSATVLDQARNACNAGTETVLNDEDLQASLWICYELSYRGFQNVNPEWETELSLLTLRNTLETYFVAGLRALTRDSEQECEPAAVPGALTALIEADHGPALATYLQREASKEQFREFVAHRSIYHLKEADPHSWAIPRLSGRAKAALVEIQADEYGGGRVERMHSELFRSTMRGLELDDSYGAFFDRVPAVTLAVSNTMSVFGLHRRWTPALLGHLAVFEMTSSLPNRRYGNGLRRLGYPAATTHFYDEHVEADAVHEQIAAHEMCGSHALEHPESTRDILFGAACALAVDNAASGYLLEKWTAGASALLPVQSTAAA
jgi:hypothetical protein